MLPVKILSEQKCNTAQQDFVDFLDTLTITDEVKDRIKSKSSMVAYYSAIAGMEASKDIAEQMLDKISHAHDEHDDNFANNISRSAGIAIISSIQILIDSVDQPPKNQH